MSGAPAPNRIVTFLEVHFSRNWQPDVQPDPYTEFISWNLYLTQEGESGSISITRSDGKVLSFDVTNNSGIVQTRENVIRWTSYGDLWPGSDRPFQ